MMYSTTYKYFFQADQWTINLIIKVKLNGITLIKLLSSLSSLNYTTTQQALVKQMYHN